MHIFAAVDPGVLSLMLAAVILLIAAVRLLWKRVWQHWKDRQLPPLVYPKQGADLRRASSVEPPAERSAGEDRVTFSPVASGTHLSSSVTVNGERNGNGASGPKRPSVRESSAAPRLSGAIPADDPGATLQLLPGRLEPADAGMDQEIRFVRIPGKPRFTLGRSSGPAHTHVQLPAATASRMHASMEFEHGRWRIGNLSQTNCVVVNGSPLNGNDSCLLRDGDRIEFGELTFVFRER